MHDPPQAPRVPRAVWVWAGGAALAGALAAYLAMPAAPVVEVQGGDPGLGAEVAEALPEDAAVGLFVAVVDGEEVRQATLGTTDGSAPVRADTAFETGSVHKTLTATLLAAMVDGGEVRFDTTLEEVWTEVDFTDEAVAGITLEQLATHHSGLPAMHNDAANLAAVGLHNFLGTDPYRWTADPVEAAAGLSDGPEGDGAYTYSNLGYALLGQTLARAAGDDYPTVLSARVLDPLGLDDTTTLSTAEVPEHGAHPHRNPTLRVQPSFNPANAPAGLGTWSTGEDMVSLLQAAMAGEDPAVTSALEPRARGEADSPHAERTGLAWVHWSLGEADVAWHNGATAGSRSFIAHTEDGRGVVVLANSTRVPVETIGLRLLDPDAPEFGGAATTPFPATVMAYLLAGAIPLLVLLRMARRRVTSRTPPLDKTGAAGTLLLGAALWVLSFRVGDPDPVPVLWAAGAGALAAAAVLAVWRWPSLPLTREGHSWSRWADLAVTALFAAGIAAGIVAATR